MVQDYRLKRSNYHKPSLRDIQSPRPYQRNPRAKQKKGEEIPDAQ